MARVGWSALALNLAAFAVTAPLALAWFGQVAPISPLVNLVATPWVAAVVVPFAVSWSALASIWPQAAAPLEPALSWTLATLLDGVEAWAELAGSAQSAQWPLPMAILVTVGLLLLPSSGARRHLGLALAALGACGLLWARAPPRPHDLALPATPPPPPEDVPEFLIAQVAQVAQAPQAT